MRILCREELLSTDKGLTLGRFLVQDPLSKSIKWKVQHELESSILFIKMLSFKSITQIIFFCRTEFSLRLFAYK
jgi:hypothetical protein